MVREASRRVLGMRHFDVQLVSENDYMIICLLFGRYRLPPAPLQSASTQQKHCQIDPEDQLLGRWLALGCTRGGVSE